MCVCVSRLVISDSATPQTVALQASLSAEFSRQEYWSGLPFPSPEELPNPGIEPWSPASQADSLPSELQGTPSKSLSRVWLFVTPWTRATRLFSSVHGDSPGYSIGVGSHSLLQGIFPPRDQTRSPALQADSLPAELPGKSRQILYPYKKPTLSNTGFLWTLHLK